METKTKIGKLYKFFADLKPSPLRVCVDKFEVKRIKK